MPENKIYSLLCLGDSYTIGEGVSESECFPLQTVAGLKENGFNFDKPIIIARTGWTTDELSNAIRGKKLQNKFDFVTLLIGVNNQYRGRDTENYKAEFRQLLSTAIDYAGGNSSHVFVLSIPDWGVTPFGAKDPRGEKKIGEEIDLFNKANREITLMSRVNYIDITPVSREAKNNPDLIAKDGLHPSGKMYKEWAKILVTAMTKKITQ